MRGRKAITAKTALKLEAEFGTPAHLWLGLQTDYDLMVARRELESAPLAS